MSIAGTLVTIAAAALGYWVVRSVMQEPESTFSAGSAPPEPQPRASKAPVPDSSRRNTAANPRTATRHLPAGRLSVRSVAVFTVANCLLFVAATLLFLPRNPLPLLLSGPVLLWLLGYSYAKRFTSGAHFWLGIALALAPVAAWIAIRGGIAWPPVLLGLAVLMGIEILRFVLIGVSLIDRTLLVTDLLIALLGILWLRRPERLRFVPWYQARSPWLRGLDAWLRSLAA